MRKVYYTKRYTISTVWKVFKRVIELYLWLTKDLPLEFAAKCDFWKKTLELCLVENYGWPQVNRNSL